MAEGGILGPNGDGYPAEPKRGQEAQRAHDVESTFNASRKGIPDEVIVLVIAWDSLKGNIQLQGPIGNKGQCYMMLELAKDAVRQYVAERIPGVQPL